MEKKDIHMSASVSRNMGLYVLAHKISGDLRKRLLGWSVLFDVGCRLQLTVWGPNISRRLMARSTAYWPLSGRWFQERPAHLRYQKHTWVRREGSRFWKPRFCRGSLPFIHWYARAMNSDSCSVAPSSDRLDLHLNNIKKVWYTTSKWALKCRRDSFPVLQ